MTEPHQPTASGTLWDRGMKGRRAYTSALDAWRSSDKSDPEQEPKTWGVIRVGKARFYWVAEYPCRRWSELCEAYGRPDEGRVFADGFAETEEEAASQALAACEAATGHYVGGGDGGHLMRERYRNLYARKPKPSDATDAQPQNTLGSLWDKYGREYPITKITAKRVWIRRTNAFTIPIDGSKGTPLFVGNTQRHLDREKLEREGYDHQGHWSETGFYTDAGWQKEQERRRGYRSRPGHSSPEFELLDLPNGFTASDVNRAFRHKAHEMHPDKGGDADAFRHLLAEKDRAMRSASHT